jgi:hypothetical protein
LILQAKRESFQENGNPNCLEEKTNRDKTEAYVMSVIKKYSTVKLKGAGLYRRGRTHCTINTFTQAHPKAKATSTAIKCPGVADFSTMSTRRGTIMNFTESRTWDPGRVQ